MTETENVEQTDDCTFLYFKPSGKWKYEGRGRFPKPQKTGYWECTRAEIIRENGGMPGITTDASDMTIVVVPDDDCNCQYAWPRLLPINARNTP